MRKLFFLFLSIILLSSCNPTLITTTSTYQYPRYRNYSFYNDYRNPYYNRHGFWSDVMFSNYYIYQQKDSSLYYYNGNKRNNDRFQYQYNNPRRVIYNSPRNQSQNDRTPTKRTPISEKRRMAKEYPSRRGNN